MERPNSSNVKPSLIASVFGMSIGVMRGMNITNDVPDVIPFRNIGHWLFGGNKKNWMKRAFRGIFIPSGKHVNVRGTYVRNPRIAAQMNAMHDKWYAGKFSGAPATSTL